MRHHRQLCSACGVRKDPCPRLARGEPCPYTPASYAPALEQAQMMMEATELEPTSALKQAGSDNGIPYGPEMETFVKWARKQWGI